MESVEKGYIGWNVSSHVQNVYWSIRRFGNSKTGPFYTVQAQTNVPQVEHLAQSIVFIRDLESVRRLAATLNEYLANVDSEGVSLTE